MTLFKIDLDALVTGGGVKIEDQEVQKLLQQMQPLLQSFESRAKRLEATGKPTKKAISKLWKKADDKLKDRTLSPELRKGFQSVRKTTDALWRQLDALGIK